MSIVNYLACSVKLPTGLLCKRPSLRFANYNQYRKSDQYITPDFANIPPPYDFSLDIYEKDFPVHIYHSEKDICALSLEEYSETAPVTRFLEDIGENSLNAELSKDSALQQAVAHHFSLPHKYYISPYSENSLRKFLCSYLSKEDKAELYSCLALTESLERDRSRDKTINLQEYLDYGNLSISNGKPLATEGTVFKTYLGPQKSIPDNSFVQRIPAIEVYQSEKWESIPYELAEMVGYIEEY